MTRQEANAAISALLNVAYKAVSDAEDIADAHGIGFNLDIGGYGMGGGYSDGEWQASSQSC